MTDVTRRDRAPGYDLEGQRILRGMTLFALGAIMNTSVSPIYKVLDQDMAAIDIVAIRGVLSAFVVLCFLYISQGPCLRIIRPELHLLRGFLNFATWFGVVYAVRNLALAEAQALIYTEALFAPIAFAIFMNKKIGRQTVLLTCLGFVGVLVVCLPALGNGGATGNALGWLAGIGAALSFALLFVVGSLIRAAEGGEGQMAPMLLTSAVVTAFLGFAAAVADSLWLSDHVTSLESAYGEVLDGRSLLLLLTASILSSLAGGMLAQGACLAHAYATPWGLISLPLSYALGFLAFGEQPADHVVYGGAIIGLALGMLHIGKIRQLSRVA